MPSVVVLVGPTASGKTALGVELALELGAEIVNADAMQLYRGMDIGTAKPTVSERRGVAHHLLDVLEPSQEASVADFQRLARAAVEEVLGRGRGVVVVGGSGLYVRALLDDLRFPGTDPRVRARLEEELVTLGPAGLHARLAARDPAAAAAVLPSNGRRLVRALEVLELTGGSFVATLPAYAEARWGADQVGLDPPLPDLDERIRARVDAMWEAGLVAEVRRLREGRGGVGRTAGRALGYAQVSRLLDGELGEDEARAQTVQATRRFARRQRSWFRRDPRVRWLPWPTGVAQVRSLLRSGGAGAG
jgi:tRNA dimethylallyltransferase